MSEFDFNPVGTVGAANTSSSDERLKKIQELVEENNKMLKNILNENTIAKEDVVAPAEEQKVEESVLAEEAPVVEENPNNIDELLAAVNNPETSVTPAVEEEKIETAPVAETETPQPVEEPFSPVEEVTSLPKIEEKQEENNIITMDDLLKEEPQEPTVIPYEEPVIAEETPAVSEPIVEEDKLITPVETPVLASEAPVLNTPVMETSAAPEVTPIAGPVETPVLTSEVPEVNTPVMETPAAPEVTPIAKKDVTDSYAGMKEVKTGNDPHRVVIVFDNLALMKNANTKVLGYPQA